MGRLGTPLCPGTKNQEGSAEATQPKLGGVHRPASPIMDMPGRYA